MIVIECIDKDVYDYNHGYNIWTGKDRTGSPTLEGDWRHPRRGCPRRGRRSIRRGRRVNNTRLAVDFFVTLPEWVSEGTARLLPWMGGGAVTIPLWPSFALLSSGSIPVETDRRNPTHFVTRGSELICQAASKLANQFAGVPRRRKFLEILSKEYSQNSKDSPSVICWVD